MPCDKGIIETSHVGAYLYTRRYIKCGKSNCKKCPHGPYWYVEGPSASGGKFKRYLGKDTPADVKIRQQRIDLSL